MARLSIIFTTPNLANRSRGLVSDTYSDDATEAFLYPERLRYKVARLHLGKLGVELTQLSKEQAAYIGVAQHGPYKPEHYHY